MKTIEISLSDCNGEAEPETDFQKRRILRHLKKLEKTLIKACESGAFSGGLEMVEKTLKKSSDKFCRRVVRTVIESRDVDCRRVRCGGPGCSFRGATRKTVVTGFGKVAYRRRRFRNHLDESLFVADERLDLVDGYFTPLAARQLLLLYSRMPVREALDTAAALGPVRCAPSRLLALAKRFGAEWGEVREAALAQIRESEPMLSGVEQIMVQLDGAGIRRIEEKQGDGKAGKTEVQWREAANGVVCLLDAEGECLKTSYFSFMPESLKPSLKLGLTAEVSAAQERYPGARLVAVADGAAELWAFPGGAGSGRGGPGCAARPPAFEEGLQHQIRRGHAGIGQEVQGAAARAEVRSERRPDLRQHPAGLAGEHRPMRGDRAGEELFCEKHGQNELRRDCRRRPSDWLRKSGGGEQVAGQHANEEMRPEMDTGGRPSGNGFAQSGQVGTF